MSKASIENKDILCALYDIEDCEIIRSLLEEKGFQLIICDSRNDAIELARENNFSAIILESWVGSMSGLFIHSEIRRFDLKTPIIFFSTKPFLPRFEQILKEAQQTYLANSLDKIVETILKLTSTVES